VETLTGAGTRTFFAPASLTKKKVFKNWHQTGLGILEKHEVPFDLYVVPGSLCHVATIAEKFPKLKLIIDHIGKPKVQVG
jgi:predicted TIM-barrel fold metal-dependent hydrolase